MGNAETHRGHVLQDKLSDNRLLAGAMPEIMPVLFEASVMMSNSLKYVIGHLEVNAGTVREWVEGEEREYYNVTAVQASIKPILKEVMEEVPMILQGLNYIHTRLLNIAAVAEEVPAKSVLAEFTADRLADFVGAAMRDEVDAQIQAGLQARLTELGIQDELGIHRKRISHHLVDDLCTGSFWNLNLDQVIAPEDRADLEATMGHPVAVDWLSYGLRGKITPPKVQ